MDLAGTPRTFGIATLGQCILGLLINDSLPGIAIAATDHMAVQPSRQNRIKYSYWLAPSRPERNTISLTLQRLNEYFFDVPSNVLHWYLYLLRSIVSIVLCLHSHF